MQNIVESMHEKFHDDWSRNGGALGDRKSDNNNNPQQKQSSQRLETRFQV